MPVLVRAPRLRRAVVLLSVLAALGTSTHGASATALTVYGVVAGPRWSTSGSLSSYHRLDCSSTNPYWGMNACTLNVDTNLAGCRWEKQTTDSLTSVPGGSPCHVVMNGPVPWRAVGAYCHLGTTDETIKVTYTIGNQPGNAMSPVEFYVAPALAPSKTNGAATAMVQYLLTVQAKSVYATASAGVPFALGSIFEQFYVDFGVPVVDACPNYDNDRLSVGNVRDKRPDTIQSDSAPTGYISALLAAG